MQSLKKYISESVRSYKYTIKIAGEVDKNFIDLLMYNLKKFDPVKINDPVTTPVQKTPLDFETLENQPVTIIKAEFRYPATEPQILQMVQLLGGKVDMVRVLGTEYVDGLASEQEMYKNQAEHSPLLTHGELEDQGKAANKEYGESYLSRIKAEKSIEMPFEAKPTPTSYDPFKPQTSDSGKDSPMSKVKRPELPTISKK